jgi:hypothetical protein
LASHRPTWLGAHVTPWSGSVLCRLRDDGRIVQRSVKSPILLEAKHLIHASLALLTASRHGRSWMQWRELCLDLCLANMGKLDEWQSGSDCTWNEKGPCHRKSCKSKQGNMSSLCFWDCRNAEVYECRVQRK